MSRFGWTLWVILLVLLPSAVLAQSLPPHQKAVMDQYYAQNTNTSEWDIAYAWVYDNSNTFSAIIARTSNWDIAYLWVYQNSNTFSLINARTSYWDEAYFWVAGNTNDVHYMINRTSQYDEAYNWVSDNSNTFHLINGQTSLWDTAYYWGDHTTNYNEGVVKINSNADGSDPSYSLVAGVEQQITYTNNPTIDPTSDYPDNVLTQDWTTIYDVTTNVFLENQIEGQAQFWRMDVSWSNKSENLNEGLEWKIRNPISGFERTMQITLPSGITEGRMTFPVMYTYADTNSMKPPTGIGLGGYEFYFETTKSTLDVTINDVTRYTPQKN